MLAFHEPTPRDAMKNQFETLQGWIPEVLSPIKKEIKTDHLGSDPAFYKGYFGNRPQNRLTVEEIFAAYEKELLKGNEDLGEWVVNRWVLDPAVVYTHFADKLAAINPQFNEIKSLSEEESAKILKGAPESFGAINTFLFSVLNGVVFPEKVLLVLRKMAESERAAQKSEEIALEEKLSLEQAVQRHQREMNRMQEKYESRLAGVQKKYAADTEALKKQIRALQKQLAEKK